MELQQCSGDLEEHDLNSEEEDTIMSFPAAPEAVPAFPRPALPKATILESLRTMKSKDTMECTPRVTEKKIISDEPIKLLDDELVLNILTENLPWLSKRHDDHLTTTYSRLLAIQHVISPYAYEEETTARFDISRDGQAASYSKDGLSWQTIDFLKWPDLLTAIAGHLREAILAQMPSGMLASDLVDGAIADDMTKNSPHRQDQNRPSMEAKLKIFKTRMLSANEERHKLLKSSGELNDPKIHQYLERDQYI
ncbi:hypothetical protein HWV62_45378 [Athelia sp. TMB]|nr:hypothetical protein HWV62_45378 [Athelia sp. TMB]